MKLVRILFLIAPLLLCANSEEAKRFFEEYTALKTSGSAAEQRAKLDAALTLAPKNEQYRYEELQWIFKYRCRKNVEEIRQAVERALRFQQDFPNSKYWIWDVRMCYPLQENLTPQADELRAVIRREYQAECRRLMKVDPGAEFKTPADIERYSHYMGYILRETYYRGSFSPDFLNERKEYMLDFIKRINAYLDKHPEKVSAVEKISLGASRMNSFFESSGSYSSEKEKFYVGYYLSLDDFIAELNRSKLPQLRFIGQELITIQNLIRAGDDESAIRKVYFDYFAILDQEFPGFTSGKRGTYSGWMYINDFLRFEPLSFWSIKRLKKEETYGCNLLVEYLTRSDGEISLPAIRALIVAAREENGTPAIRQLIAAAPVIRKHGYDFLTIRNNCYPLGNLFNHLYSNQSKISNSLRAELFTAINQPFDFTEIPAERILAAAQQENSIYFMCHRLKDDIFQLYELDCGTNRVQLLSAFPRSGEDIYQEPGSMQGNIRFLRVSAHHIVFAGTDFIWIGRRGNGGVKWYPLTDLPPELTPTGLEIVNDRLYLLSSGDLSGSRKNKMLISMNMEGKERKIHFASARFEALSPLDEVKSGVAAGLFRENDKSLFLAMFQDNRTTLWRLDVVADKFTEIAALPGSSNCYMNYDDGSIWVTIGSFGDSIYRADPSNGAWEHFFHGEGGIRDRSKPRYQMHGDRETNGPLLVRNGKLWIGGWMQFCVDLENPRQSQMLAMQRSHNIFEYHGKIFFITPNAVYVFKEAAK